MLGFKKFISEESMLAEQVQMLVEKLVVFNGGAKYGQIVFMSGGAGCFDGETLVHTESGYKKISEIQPGEKVWTFSEETGEKELCEVEKLNVFEDHPEEILELTFDNGETVVCTENHEFYVDGEWVKAKDLKASKKVVQNRKTYDLSVKGNHNYEVTKSNFPVHNSGKGFASSSFMESEKFRIRDVDEWKKAFLAISELKDKYPEIQGLDLRKGKDVFALHMFVKKLGVKDKTLDLLLSDVKADRLPNIIFDITGKSMSDFEEVVPHLQKAGYDAKNIHLAWVLTDYRVAYAANLTRDRVVPADVFLDTHVGAAKTMMNLIDSKKMPRGANGRFVVILNNRENTVFFAQGEKFKGKIIPHKTGGVKDFYYVTIKEAGKGFNPEEKWKEELHKQIVNNIPGGDAGINSMRLAAIEILKKDLVKKDKMIKAYAGIGIAKNDMRSEKKS